MSIFPSPFESGLRLMEAQQQLAARSLINLIAMISTTSTRMASETGDFTREALDLMNEAATRHDPAGLAEVQQKWSALCLKYGQTQTRAAMSFVEHCGQQALNVAARSGLPPEDAQG